MYAKKASQVAVKRICLPVEKKAGDSGSNPASRRSPGGGYGNPLQYSCLGNRMDRGVWWATEKCPSSSIIEWRKDGVELRE